MTYDDRLNRALNSGQPGPDLYDVVKTMLAEGQERDVLYARLTALMLAFRSVGREEQDDAVMEVMDALKGSCSPQWRL